MGSIEEKAEEKLDNLIQQTDALDDAESSGGAAAPAPPPSPPPEPRATLDSFKGKRKANKTECNICNRYYVDIDEHLSVGKSGCSKVVKKLGYGDEEPEITPVEMVLEPLFGAMIVGAILDLLEDWLTPYHRQVSQDWKDKNAAAIQQIAQERVGDIVKSPYMVLLVSGFEYCILNRDGIRRKFKDEELPDDPPFPDGFKAGSPPTGSQSAGVRGDSGNREDPDGSGVS